MAGGPDAPVVVPTGDPASTLVATIVATAIQKIVGLQSRQSLTRAQRVAFEKSGGQIQRLGKGRRRFIYQGKRIGIKGAMKVAREYLHRPITPRQLAPSPPPPRQIVSRPPPPSNLPQPWTPPQTDEELEQFYEESGLEDTDIGVWDPAYGWSGLIKTEPQKLLSQIAQTVPNYPPKTTPDWSHNRPPTSGRPPVRNIPGLPEFDWPKLPNIVMPVWWFLYGVLNPSTTATQKEEEEGMARGQKPKPKPTPQPKTPKTQEPPKPKIIEKIIERIIYQPVIMPSPAPAPAPAPVPVPAPAPAPAPTVIISMPTPAPVPVPKTRLPIKYSNYLAPIVLALLNKPKPKNKRRVQTDLAPTPLTEPLTSPLTSTDAGTCECKPKTKRKRKKKPRAVCYTGTYTEYSDGLVKRKRRKVKCNVRRNSKGNQRRRRRG